MLPHVHVCMSLRRRWTHVTAWARLYVVATSVDPCYRMCMSVAEQQTKATALPVAEVQQERQTTGAASLVAKRY